MATEIIIRYAKLLLFFAIVWAVMWLWNTQGCRKVEGRDMDPTIPADAFKWYSPGVPSVDRLQRDDIVIYEYIHSGKSQRSYAARVIALPGDRVRIKGGEVLVNDNAIPYDYVNVNSRSSETLEEIIVPRDSVYVLCDNRKATATYDSRGVGPVGMWAILGKVR